MSNQWLAIDVATAPAQTWAPDSMNFPEGTLWSEGGAGTNAIGTALAAEHAVQVCASGHFNEIVQSGDVRRHAGARSRHRPDHWRDRPHRSGSTTGSSCLPTPRMRRSRLAATCRLCPK